MVSLRTYRLRLMAVLPLILLGTFLEAPGCQATPVTPRPEHVSKLLRFSPSHDIHYEDL
mgnify:CR=1 FL=1